MTTVEQLTWLNIISLIVIPILVALVSIVTTQLGFKNAIKILEPTNAANINKLKYESILRAHEGCWRLLAYMTEVENQKSIITWIRQDKIDTYYFDPITCKSFFEELRFVFYDEGHGLYFSPEVSTSLFKNRNVLYGLLLKCGTNDEKIKLTNSEMVKAFYQETEQLRSNIRTNIELTERKLELKK